MEAGNIVNLPIPEIIQALKDGLNYLILGFQNIGFRRVTKEHLHKVDEQLTLLTQHNLDQERRIKSLEQKLLAHYGE